MNSRDLRSAAVALLLAVAWAAPVLAQGTGAVLIRGQLLDADTRAPVAGAFIALEAESMGVLSDSMGAFMLPVGVADTYALKVRQLGYRDLAMTVTAESARKPFFLQLYPDPVEIEGLRVLVQRFEDRRRGPFGVVDVLDQKVLVDAPGGSGVDLIKREVPFARPCDSQTEQLCLNQMGRLEPLTVCIDGHRVSEMMAELEHVDPRSLYMVEVFRRTGQVHMYTRGYVQRLLDTGAELPPLSFGCGQVGLPGPEIR
ncbi:MAG TPA: carboxypeptidase-like regulatory domain-containing protein [Longimicrobiales bacterium]|nr:carboxypeptidase-like regulatory domain-containing protein [Longimicrobiales bacterium]